MTNQPAHLESEGTAPPDQDGALAQLEQARALIAQAQAEADAARQDAAQARRAYLVERTARELDPTIPPEFLSGIPSAPGLAAAEDEAAAVREAVEAAARRWRECAARAGGSAPPLGHSDIGAPTNPTGQRPLPAVDFRSPPDPVTNPKAYRAWRQRVGLSSQ